jgi:hypothetical protein
MQERREAGEGRSCDRGNDFQSGTSHIVARLPHDVASVKFLSILADLFFITFTPDANSI